MQFPNDETGLVLRDMAEAGFDFSEEYVVDFFALFHSEQDATTVAELFLAKIDNGEPFVKVESRHYEHGGKDSEGIELQVSKIMTVTYENISEFELEYKRIAEKHKGYSDGWGVFMGDDEEGEDDSYVE